MKKILLSIIILLSLTAFAYPQKKKIKKQKESITQIVYETFSRRGRTEVTITRDSAISIGRTEKKYIVMTTATWNELVNSIKAVKLSTIPLLAAPTKKREYDGAAHCKITVATKENKYESQYFDSGKPMKSLQTLYKAIDSLRNAIGSDGKVYAE